MLGEEAGVLMNPSIELSAEPNILKPRNSVMSMLEQPLDIRAAMSYPQIMSSMNVLEWVEPYSLYPQRALIR